MKFHLSLTMDFINNSVNLAAANFGVRNWLKIVLKKAGFWEGFNSLECCWKCESKLRDSSHWRQQQHVYFIDFLTGGSGST